ncbi:MAG: hypothetical protein KC457_35235 [Myxococcales bacterium]|nr:hypothetical protein [Myxococcales bacterium]
MSDDETTQPDREAPLIEALAGAWRPRDPRELRSHPAFWDLSEDGRRRAHALALASRPLEAALDEDGYSTTVRAVLGRLRR